MGSIFSNSVCMGISPEEIKGSPAILRSLDENQDGILQFEELRPNIPPFILDQMRERPSGEEAPDQSDIPGGPMGGFGRPGGPMGGPGDFGANFLR